MPRCIAGVPRPVPSTSRGAPRPLLSLNFPTFVRLSAPGFLVKPTRSSLLRITLLPWLLVSVAWTVSFQWSLCIF